MIAMILFTGFLFTEKIFKSKNNIIDNSTIKNTVTFEKYSKSLQDLETTEEYTKLCTKLAEYAGCNNAYITSDKALVVANINGTYVATTVATNIYWIATETGNGESNLESLSIEDFGVFYTEYYCTDAGVKLGDIIPEKFVEKPCKLSSEVEKSLGYTTEEMVQIYISRFNFERDYSHSKFKTEPK